MAQGGLKRGFDLDLGQLYSKGLSPADVVSSLTAQNIILAAGTAKVADNISEVNAGAAKTGTASGHVLTAAKSLSDESTRLKTEVGKFLATVRAA